MQAHDNELLVAISERHIDKVGRLLYHGADPNTLNDTGIPALQLACETGELNIVEHLLNAGATVEQFDRQQKTAIHISSYWGFVSIMRRLIEAGASVDKQCGCGWAPIHAGVMSENIQAVFMSMNYARMK